MKRLLTCLLVLIPALSFGYEQHRFVRALDLNTPPTAATAQAVLATTNLLTATTYNALGGQPDTPRNVVLVVVDTTPSIVAGVVTVTGTDVNDAVQTEAISIAAGAGTYTGTKVFKTIVTLATGTVTVLGGAGDETIAAGSGALTSYVYCSSTDPTTPAGNPAITTSGIASTTITAVSGTPFQGMGLGDEIQVLINGTLFKLKITTFTSNVSVVVDQSVTIASAGLPFKVVDLTCGSSDNSGWLNSQDLTNKTVVIQVDAFTATTTVLYSIECRGSAGDFAPKQLIAGSFTTAHVVGLPSTTSEDTFPIFETCASIRVGLQFSSTDTAGTDSIQAYLNGEKR